MTKVKLGETRKNHHPSLLKLSDRGGIGKGKKQQEMKTGGQPY